MRSGLPSADSLAAPKSAHVLDPSDSKIYTCLGQVEVRLRCRRLTSGMALEGSPLCVPVTPQTCVSFSSGPLAWVVRCAGDRSVL